MFDPELFQASAVAIGGRALIIEGPPGSGKSSLALALIDRGASLIGDDGLALIACDDRVYASPAPRIARLIEVRNLGLLDFAYVADVPVALVVRLDDSAPRHIETAETTRLAGIALPLVRLWPHSPVLVLRAEHALSRYGLT